MELEHSDGEDSDIAPPSDHEYDMMSSVGDFNPADTSSKAPTGPSPQAAGKATPNAKDLFQRRSRGSMIFAPTPTQEIKNKLKRGGSPTSPSAAEGPTFDTVYVPEDVHELQQALKYRMMMQPKAVPLSRADDAHLTSLISNYLVSHGFHRTATSLRNALGPDMGLRHPDDHLPTSKHDLNCVVSNMAKKVGLLFDDDSAWSTDNMTLTQIPLQVVDSHTGATGGTLDTLLEKLIFDSDSFTASERGETTVLDISKITFSSIFLVTCACFVNPDALFSRLSKMFKTISAQHMLLGETRRILLLKRILHFLLKWAQTCAIDFRRVVFERIASFSMSIIRSGGHHYEVVQLATALLQRIQPFVEGNSIQLAVASPVLPTRALETVPATMPLDADIRKLTDCSDVEFARQLSLYHFDLMAKVRPREFLNAAWTEHPIKLICGRLNEFIEFAGAVTQWLASLIVIPQEEEPRKAIYAKSRELPARGATRN